jgi:hypothetical protein
MVHRQQWSFGDCLDNWEALTAILVDFLHWRFYLLLAERVKGGVCDAIDGMKNSASWK